ncbi:MAG: MBL fold metallo-hydrolase [Clostridiales bacterium]|nr:MBL fold metallo-hydrolase [Clostridiales bacterium]
MDLRFCPMFSGSSGNALYVGSGEVHLLVDAGKPGSRVAAELAGVRVDARHLAGILITHEHNDHIAGAGILSRRYDLRIYASGRAWAAMEDRLGKIAPHNVCVFEPGEDFYIGHLSVTPFRTPHDAVDPVGFAFRAGGLKLAVATDIGCVRESWIEQVAGADIALLESNHDVGMLKAGRYPYELKRRILSSHGHLSNDDAACAAVELCRRGVRNIILGHLSGENNFPELAYQSAAQALAQAGFAPGVDVGLSVALRERRSALFTASDEPLQVAAGQR